MKCIEKRNDVNIFEYNDGRYAGKSKINSLEAEGLIYRLYRWLNENGYEEEIEDVPIRAVNMPVGKHLRTFPAKINISFVAGVSVYRSLKPTDFVVIADYNEIINHPTEKCHIYLKSVPRGISRARLEVSMVDYLIEDVE